MRTKSIGIILIESLQVDDAGSTILLTRISLKVLGSPL